MTTSSDGVRQVTDTFVRVSTRLLLWSMVPLAAGICIDFYLISSIMLPRLAAAACAVLLVAVFLLLWFALPRVAALQRLIARTP